MTAAPREAAAGPPFAHVPVYVPPMGRRPRHQPTGLTAMRNSSRNLLSNLPAEAFLWETRTFDLLGRTMHLFNRPDLVRAAFITGHDAFERKSPQQINALEPLIGDALLVSDGATWRSRREIVGPIMHGRHVPAFVPLMIETALEWRARWARLAREGRPVDVLHETVCLAAEIIARSIFGRTLGQEHTAELADAFGRYLDAADQLALGRMLGLPEWTRRLRPDRTRREAARLHRIVEAIVTERRAARAGGGRDGDEGCLIDRLVEARDADGNPLSEEAVRNEATMIFLAGHETTANTLAWAFYLLSQADWARRALQAEVDAVLSDGPPGREAIPRLVYTRAVVDETLRLYPPVPMLVREAVRDADVAGIAVARGSLVVAMPWLIHRHPRLWPRAPDFVPERFLPGAPRPRKGQYLPFAIGPRACPGMMFGVTEAVLCLAILAHAFELEPVPGTRVEPSARLTLRPGTSLPMTLTPRIPARAASVMSPRL